MRITSAYDARTWLSAPLWPPSTGEPEVVPLDAAEDPA